MIAVKLKNGNQFEIDGRFLREGVYSPVFEDDKKTGRLKNPDYHLLPSIKDVDIKGIWIDVPKRLLGYWSEKISPIVLEGLVKNFPKKTPGKELREYVRWMPGVFRKKEEV